jgi:hypothetical protein
MKGFLKDLKQTYKITPAEVEKLNKESFKNWVKRSGYKKGDAIKSLNESICRTQS